VHLYNDPSESLSFEGFDVHRHLAWLYLLHAELTTLNQYGARLGSGPGAGSCWRRVGYWFGPDARSADGLSAIRWNESFRRNERLKRVKAEAGIGMSARGDVAVRSGTAP
jgi:hypothetical protein